VTAAEATPRRRGRRLWVVVVVVAVCAVAAVLAVLRVRVWQYEQALLQQERILLATYERVVAAGFPTEVVEFTDVARCHGGGLDTSPCGRTSLDREAAVAAVVEHLRGVGVTFSTVTCEGTSYYRRTQEVACWAAAPVGDVTMFVVATDAVGPSNTARGATFVRVEWSGPASALSEVILGGALGPPDAPIPELSAIDVLPARYRGLPVEAGGQEFRFVGELPVEGLGETADERMAALVLELTENDFFVTSAGPGSVPGVLWVAAETSVWDDDGRVSVEVRVHVTLPAAGGAVEARVLVFASYAAR